jgi:hypothetical protein
MHLSDIVAVAIIVAFSMHHRISGILALLVVIACMQHMHMQYNNNSVVEGIDNSMQTPDSESPERIKKRVCVTGVNTATNAYEYMLSPALLKETNQDVIRIMETAMAKGCKSVCHPSCKWAEATKATKEGFTPTVEVSPIQNMKNVVKDNVRKAKTMTESFFSR